MVQNNVFSGEAELFNNHAQVPTIEYANLTLADNNSILSWVFNSNRMYIRDLLEWKLSFRKEKKREIPNIPAIYPEDAFGVPETGEKNGIIRFENLSTFSSIDKDTGEIQYIARRRPDIDNSNTPWDWDPGMFSHWWMKQAWIINAWRYVADKLWKNDGDLTQKEYLEYLKDNPFPQYTSVLDAWSFIIANGSNKRNNWKAKEEYEQRTSWLLNITSIVVPPESFQEIIKAQETSLWDIEYQALTLDTEVDTSSYTPKHQAVHHLLWKVHDEVRAVLS